MLVDKIEQISIFFQGGLRRGVLYFLGIVLLLLWPFQYVGIYTSRFIGRRLIDKSITVSNPINSQAKPLISEKTTVIQLSNNQRDMFLTIDNKENKSVGFSPYIYKLSMYSDQGTLLNTEIINSYILPGDIKYIVKRDATGTANKLTLEEQTGTQAVDYNPIANPFQRLPKIDVESTKITKNEDNTVTVSGLFNNRDKLAVETVDVLYIIRDRREQITGIGTYKFNGFTAGSIRDFEATHPNHIKLDPQFVEVRWETNYFKDKNITF
jgi:hypothetical protein